MKSGVPNCLITTTLIGWLMPCIITASLPENTQKPVPSLRSGSTIALVGGMVISGGMIHKQRQNERIVRRRPSSNTKLTIQSPSSETPSSLTHNPILSSPTQQSTNSTAENDIVLVQQFIQNALKDLDLLPYVLNKIIEGYYVDDMSVIRKWDDVIPFAGKIVAYDASAYYYTHGDTDKGGTYRIGGSLCAGYVWPRLTQWQGGGYGYEMARLLWKKAVPGACALTSELIASNDGGKMFMRVANNQEKVEMLAALEKEEAEFDYMFFFKEKVLSLLREKNL